MKLVLSGLRRCAAPVVLLLWVALLAGCAATQTQALLRQAPDRLPRKTELSATPFFPQEQYQCGPATLAMALNAAGIAATPESLKPQVYLPQREGSLQAEMLAAGRRNGAIAMTIPPRMDALLSEVAAGNPVIVLENLSLPIFPMWHYALVIGYDLDQGEIVLRSGTTKRMVLPLSTFEHTWSRSNYWGMVTMPTDRLPATAQVDDTIAAVLALEKSAAPAQARNAYATALRRWPDNVDLLIGYGNAAYAAGDRIAAAAAFRRATELHPESAPAFNNLASILAELGQLKEARLAAEKAVALGGSWRDTALATLREIELAQRRQAR
jgi:tetratricopeptide (TPR) repeat protein